MKKRLPTSEEIRIWRESNRFTDGVKDEGIKEAQAPPLVTPMLATVAVAPATPVKKKAPLPPLAPLSAREGSRLLKTAGPVQATLDLHGLSKTEAHGRVRHFLQHQQRAGRRHVAIITGKGRGGEVGVLRSQLPHWLNEAPLRATISAFTTARPEKGGAGVLHVLLKRT